MRTAGRWSGSRTQVRRLVTVAALVGATLAGVSSAAPAGARPSRPTVAHRSARAVAQTTRPRAGGVRTMGAHTVTYDHYSFIIDGRRTYLWSGEFHYFRLPSPSLWMDIFQKMKAAGFNTVSLYFDWGYHSPRPGVYDFTGVRNVDKLLDMAQKAGLYVIVRPAPYINAEVDSGGLPGWLTTKREHNRSDDPRFLHYAYQWMTQIDRRIARHQLTNGTGTVIAYQIENEYYNGKPAGRLYMRDLERKARADGITVPLTGNNNGTFSSGVGALNVDGPDSYPQGFNCSSPKHWSGVPDLSYDHPARYPLYAPEFQGGSFDPWGGPGYDKCAQLINGQFANVFYKQNIAVGATAQSFYMTYGGTNWGWLSIPENYTSYDYGAAIRENRQLSPKYYQEKLIGYFTQAVSPLTMTEPIASYQPSNPAIVDTARMNPDTGTQFHVLRHANSASTTVDRTHIALNFNATPTADNTFTDDDRGSALRYSAGWSHVANQMQAANGTDVDTDYRRTLSLSKRAGASVNVTFTGTAVQWLGPQSGDQGYADVYIDGRKRARVDCAGGANRAVLYDATRLRPGTHTLRIVVVGSHPSGSTGNYVAVDAINVPPMPTAPATYPLVPQQPGTAITLNGRDSRIIVANYRMGDAQLQYSTSEIMTWATVAGRDVAVLYGNPGSDGETVLNYPAEPTVKATGGAVSTYWNASTGDLRLDYRHTGLIRVTITEPGRRPLLLLLAAKPVAESFWRQDTAAGPVLVRGTHLLRTAASDRDGRLALTGDNGSDPRIEVFSSARTVSWNGHPVRMTSTPSGSLVGRIPTAVRVHLPALTNWRHEQESPETAPGFDDSSWRIANKTTTNSITPVPSKPILFADDYGFHTGNVWYRGRFQANAMETGIHLVSDSGGTAQAFSAWLNGHFLGSSTSGHADFTFPPGVLRPIGDNVISVLTINMGHDEDYDSTNANKTARGLTAASLLGTAHTSISWRIQGNLGGEHIQDPVRGTLAYGGLYGERMGWDLPGYPDRRWAPVTLPTSDHTAGVSWYRTTTTLHLPRNQDTSVGITFSDQPNRRYRALLYVNGWLMGDYVNYLGPEHSFPIPNGILRTGGRNTIAIAVWNLDASTGGLGRVRLTNYGSYASSLRVAPVDSPGYGRAG